MINLKKDYYFIIVVIFSGSATSFFRSHLGLIFLFILGAFVFGKTLLRPTRSLVICLLVWLIYFAINTVIIGSFHPFFMATYIIYIYIAWWLGRYYGDNVFHLYSEIIYYLCLIGLFFWTWQLVSPSSLTSIMSYLDVSGDDVQSMSMLVYTKHYLESADSIPRNAGFTWEPGPFACFVALALFFYIAKAKASMKYAWRPLVFVAAIITTQSTTGYLLLLSLFGWYVWTKFTSNSVRFILLPIVAGLLALVYFNVSFLNEKIEDESKQDIYALIDHAEASGKTYNPGRFASLVLRYEDFKRYPIAGYGGNPRLQYGYLGEGNVVSSVSGIGKVFGQYGLIGSLVFLVILYRSGRFMANHFGYSGYLVFPLMVLIMGFGFVVIETPIIITFLLLPFFVRKIRESSEAAA